MSSTHHYIDLKPDKALFGDDVDPFLHDEILVERKSFLNLTEDSLKEEIANQDASTESFLDVEASDSDPSPGNEDELEKIQNIKMELSKSVNLALNETSLSLDFVSLLISSVKPNLAKSTISPHLSKTVPLGSLNADRLSKEENEPNNDKDSAMVGQGWKYESLEKIKQLFKDSSAKLNQQVLIERTYWDMINKVLSNGEVLFKTRDPSDNTKAIGVKYGYGDSGSSFHDKGVAILKKDDKTGELTFTPVVSQGNSKLKPKIYKYVKVKILSQIDDDYMLTGQSKFDFNIESKKDRIIQDIEKARFFIFEEDLFYQLMREAKTLMNYNVSIIADKILIEIQGEIIEIESVEYDESNEEELKNYYQNINNDSSKNNQKAQMILNYLKIMLCCYFKYNLSLKQKVPTNYTKFKQNNSHPLILRPLIGNIKHELYVKQLEQMVNSILETYSDKMESEFETFKYKNISSLKRIKDPFVKSVDRPVTELIIKLKNKANNKYLKIDVRITTSEILVNLILNLKIIKFEKYENMNDNEKGVNVLQLTFNDCTEIDQCLEWSIQKFLNE